MLTAPTAWGHHRDGDTTAGLGTFGYNHHQRDNHQPGNTTPGDTTAEETWMMSLVKGSVMIFSRSGASFPLRMLKVATTRRVTWCRYPVTTSSGSSTSTDSQLKQSCTVAPAKALCRGPHHHRVAPGEQLPGPKVPLP